MMSASVASANAQKQYVYIWHKALVSVGMIYFIDLLGEIVV